MKEFIENQKHVSQQTPVLSKSSSFSSLSGLANDTSRRLTLSPSSNRSPLSLSASSSYGSSSGKDKEKEKEKEKEKRFNTTKERRQSIVGKSLSSFFN
jgi:hypothetical protein